MVAVPAGTFSYRVSGEFLRDGTPANAPMTDITFDRPIAFMQRQVSAGEYKVCVDAGACPALASPAAADNLPVVGVNWHDATAYAAWLSRQTGHRYRLPTDAEWAYAAAERFRDDALTAGDAANPASRWIAAYEKESAQAASDATPLPFGSFGANAHGLIDLAGNVWEWTGTCYTRQTARADGDATTIESCGVRVVEGNHRTYMSDFIRDPRGGACSAGAPPSNIGIRLVREDGGPAERFAAGLRRLLAPRA